MQRATGQRPVGWNCNALRRSTRTLELLQEQGFIYHIDDVSRDEPFVQRVNDQPFVTVPYTLHVNDLVAYELQGFSTQAFLQLLKDEFDVLYAEGQTRRRMLVVACHDRVAGRPARAKALAEFGLSKAALEVLAIIAYRQPIAKAGVELIRGSASDSALDTLLERSLVKRNAHQLLVTTRISSW